MLKLNLGDVQLMSNMGSIYKMVKIIGIYYVIILSLSIMRVAIG